MAAAVWSTSLEEIEDFPAVTLVRFFANHGFLGIDTHPQWYVVKGGSSQYIAPLTAPYKERIRTGVRIAGVTRSHDAVQVRYENGSSEVFDEIVFACHGPQAMGLLADATPQERAVLEGFSTSRNETVLHTDEKLLPTRPNARASWNYHVGADDRAATLTYHMNRLQSLAAPEPYCVTLNATGRIKPERILREMTYFHPLMTLPAIRAQARWREISGREPHALLRRLLVLRIPRGRPELGDPGSAIAGSGLAARGVMESAIYFGTLRHRRFRPARHEFTYPLFMAYLDVDRIQELMQVSRLASYNGWNWASFNETDHFGDARKPLRERLAEDAATAWRQSAKRKDLPAHASALPGIQLQSRLVFLLSRWG